MSKTTLINLRTDRSLYYVLIDRRTIYGNRHRITATCTREQAVARFRKEFYERIVKDRVFRAAVKSLRGRKLACWCEPLACHGDVYIDYLDKENPG